MWMYWVIGVVGMLSVGLPAVGYFTKALALHHMRATIQQYNDIAATYTEHGTPDELQHMLEELHGLMEELNELDISRPCTAAARVRSRK